MFSIDLLKGKELPAKPDLKKSVLKAVPILIPILAVTVLGVSLQRDGVLLRDCQKALQDNQQQIQQHAGDVAEYNTVNARINGMTKCLNGISKALSYRVQISDVLVELTQGLPDGIFLYEMKMNRESVNQKIQEQDSAAVKQRLVVRRDLNLILCGYDASGSDPAVQDYVTELKKSPLLTEIFSDIKPSARQAGQVDGRSAVYYEIECTFREQG